MFGGVSRVEWDFVALNAVLAAWVVMVVVSFMMFILVVKLVDSFDEVLGVGIFGGMLMVGLSVSGAVIVINNGRIGWLWLWFGVMVMVIWCGVCVAFVFVYVYDGVELWLDMFSDIWFCLDVDGNFELMVIVGVWMWMKGSSVGNWVIVAVDVIGWLGDSVVFEDSSYGYWVTSSRLLGVEGDLFDVSLQSGG